MKTSLVSVYWNSSEWRFWDCFSDMVYHAGWYVPGITINLYLFRIEIVKWWRDE